MSFCGVFGTKTVISNQQTQENGL